MELFKKENFVKQFIELGITTVIFMALILNGSLLYKLDFFNVIYSLLAYIIILEIVRMLGQYVFENHIKLRTIIDTFIIFILRETILAYSDKRLDKIIEIFRINDFSFSINQKLFYIIVGVLLIFILFKFRLQAIENSPNEINCDKCVAKDNCYIAK